MSDADPHAVAGLPLSEQEEAALAEDVDLDVEMRKRVLALRRDLDRLDHYALLGVERAADRKALKRAYYELASTFHPDRYFRKKLGSFKERMEALFARMTIAHDTLTDREKRAEYDAYLEQQRRSRSIEELLADALAEARRTEEKIEREARAQEARAPAAGVAPANGSRPESAGAGAGSATPPAPAGATPRPASSPEVSASARRDALARRLLGGRPIPSPSNPERPAPSPGFGPGAAAGPAPAPSPPPARSSPAEAMEALRRRYDERVCQAKAAQARKYVENARAAIASGDAVAAANAYRIARTLLPQDPEIELGATAAQARADAVLSETYAKQAHYEEKNEQWTQAARSWQRVVKGRSQDAQAHERAANAIAKSSGDLHEAARLAQIAIALEPGSAPYRVTLARVYQAAGLDLNARRELETAAQLAPHDDTIRAMLKGAGKSA